MYYSILVSQVDKIGEDENEKIKNYLKSSSNVLILPWAFAKEMTSEEFEKNYFNIKGEKYRRYIEFLCKFGIQKENIIYANCYKETRDEIIDKIKNSDILLLPGGNPDMFFNKVVYDTEILYSIKNYKGDIIGESAGAVLHFRKYFFHNAIHIYLSSSPSPRSARIKKNPDTTCVRVHKKAGHAPAFLYQCRAKFRLSELREALDASAALPRCVPLDRKACLSIEVIGCS